LIFTDRLHMSVFDAFPYRTTMRQALKKIDDIRINQNVPLVWHTRGLQEGFERGTREQIECVEEFLHGFPEQSRNTLLSMLRDKGVAAKSPSK
jgi:hypothetical protein